MELDRRALTTDEEAIIAARLALQRRMLAEYERRERTRKVHRCGMLSLQRDFRLYWYHALCPAGRALLLSSSPGHQQHPTIELARLCAGCRGPQRVPGAR